MSGTLQARFVSAWGAFELRAHFAVPSRGITVLYGVAGAGKRRLLRCLAGLERAAEGYLELDGEVWQDSDRFVPVHRRPLGFVFGEPGLFPHLSVAGNLEFGWRRVAPAERRIGFDDTVQLLAIESLLEQRPNRLTRCERLRVAIARALLTSPRLLLMDAPLAGMDPVSRAEFLGLLERLQETLAIPTLYASACRDEAMRLADHLVWMADGAVTACGPMPQLLRQMEAAEGAAEPRALFATVVATHEPAWRLTALDSVWGRLWVRSLDLRPGKPVRVALPAGDVALARTRPVDSTLLNIWAAEVRSVEQLPEGERLVGLGCPELPDSPVLYARVAERAAEALNLRAGMPVHALIGKVELLL